MIVKIKLQGIFQISKNGYIVSPVQKFEMFLNLKYFCVFILASVKPNTARDNVIIM